MKILIDIGHPAHVHYFKNFALIMQNKGHEILFSCREKEFEIDLLKSYNFAFKSFGRKYRSNIGKILGLIEFDIKESLLGLKFNPDILLSSGSIYAAHASFLLRKPHISLEDTFNFEQIKLYLPFTKVILTADYNHPLKSNKVIRYSGYQELLYLHPNYFCYNNSILKKLGVDKNEKYVVARFVSWSASHDRGHSGITIKNKFLLIKEISKLAKVFISSENKLPDKLEEYRLKTEPRDIHHVIAGASLIIGESFTMLSEASLLGTPSILIHNTRCYYLEEQMNQYSLVKIFSESNDDQIRAIECAVELLRNNCEKKCWVDKSNRLINDKIDVTSFLVWFVENYPDSAEVMRKDPAFQYSFNKYLNRKKVRQ